jgi:hypothetical protein
MNNTAKWNNTLNPKPHAWNYTSSSSIYANIMHISAIKMTAYSPTMFRMEQFDLCTTVHTESNNMFRLDTDTALKCRRGHCTCSVFLFSNRPETKN